MDHRSVIALFAIAYPDATAIKRMPAIMNLYFLPDMGRMNGHSL
jgi:hypothetical protein